MGHVCGLWTPGLQTQLYSGDLEIVSELAISEGNNYVSKSQIS